MQKISFLLLLCAALCCQVAAQTYSKEGESALLLSFDQDDVAAFKKAIEKDKVNLQTAVWSTGESLVVYASEKGAYAVAKYIFENTSQDADKILDEVGLLHVIPCYQHDNKIAFEYLALLLKSAKKLEKDPELYRTVICRCDMTEAGYENAKIAVLALKEIGVDINGELLGYSSDENDNIKTIFLVEIASQSSLHDFALWLIEQGADPHKKVAGKSAYDYASDQLKAAIDKQAKKAAPEPQEPEKGKKKKKAKKKAKK